jgi:hypothetical protein
MLKNSILAGFAAIAITAAGSVAAPTEAQASGRVAGAFLGGLVAGAIINHATRPVYAAPVQQCWWQNQLAGYDVYGRAVYQRVQVCQ